MSGRLPGRGTNRGRGGRGRPHGNTMATARSEKRKATNKTLSVDERLERLEAERAANKEAYAAKKSEIRQLRSGRVISTELQVKIKKEALDSEGSPVNKQMRLLSPANSLDTVDEVEILEDEEEEKSAEQCIQEADAILARSREKDRALYAEPSDDELDLLKEVFGTPKRNNTLNLVEPTPEKPAAKETTDDIIAKSQQLSDDIEEIMDDDLYTDVQPTKSNPPTDLHNINTAEMNEPGTEGTPMPSSTDNTKPDFGSATMASNNNKTDMPTSSSTSDNNQPPSTEDSENNSNASRPTAPATDTANLQPATLQPSTTENNDGGDMPTPTKTNATQESQAAPAPPTPPVATQPKSYSNTVSSDNQIGHRYELSFHCPFGANEKQGTPIDPKKVVTILQGILLHVLTTGKNIDSKFQIMSWSNTHVSINKADQIPKTKHELLQYAHPAGLVMRNGMNFFWRIRMRHDALHHLDFIRGWERSKQFQLNLKNPHGYITVKNAPVQSPVWYECGYFIGTSENQVMGFNEAKLREELGESDLHISHHNIDIKNMRRIYWTRANLKAEKITKSKKRTPKFFKLRALSSPCGFQVYTTDPDKVKGLKQQLRKRLGKRDATTKNWPRLPDGCETMFVPAMRHDANTMADKMTVENRMDTHIKMKEAKTRVDIKLRDPTMQPVCLKGKTISQAILDFTHDDGKFTRPIFHSFELKWNRNRRIQEYQICFFESLKDVASEKLRQLLPDLVKIYGEGVKECFYLSRSSMPRTEETGVNGKTTTESMFGIDFDSDDDDDPYFNGQFKIAVDLSTMEGGNIAHTNHPTDGMSTVKSQSIYGDSATDGSTNSNTAQKPPPTPTAAPKSKPSVPNPYAKTTPTGEKNPVPKPAAPPPATPTKAKPANNGFVTSGSPEMKLKMEKARRFAENIIRPEILPPLTSIVQSMGDATQDRRLYLKKITGTLTNIEKALIYNDDKAPDEPLASLKDLGITKDFEEDFTEDEILHIIEHHAQYIIQKTSQPGNRDGPGSQQ